MAQIIENLGAAETFLGAYLKLLERHEDYPGIGCVGERCPIETGKPDGMLLVIARGREPNDSKGKMPWPLTKDELSRFEDLGLRKLFFEDFMDNEDPPVRRFTVTYRRK